jgi:hypothetical protein
MSIVLSCFAFAYIPFETSFWRREGANIYDEGPPLAGAKHMLRVVIALFAVFAVIGTTMEPVSAKPKKSRQVHSAVRHYRAPAPTVIAPVSPLPAPASAASPRIVDVPGAPLVRIPAGARGRDSFHDRVHGCVHYGTAAGVPTNQIGPFTAQCAR